MIAAPTAPERPSTPSDAPVGANAFAPLPQAVSVSETQQIAANAVAARLRVNPQHVCWTRVPSLATTALVVHAPWSRVVVARTVGDAYHFAQEWRSNRCTWLLDALHVAYPVEAVPPLPLARLNEVPTSSSTLTAFLRWATRNGRVGWRALPHTEVIGSWRTYRDAVVVREGNKLSVRTRQ
jgi:hypothetical protein